MLLLLQLLQTFSTEKGSQAHQLQKRITSLLLQKMATPLYWDNRLPHSIIHNDPLKFLPLSTFNLHVTYFSSSIFHIHIQTNAYTDLQKQISTSPTHSPLHEKESFTACQHPQPPLHHRNLAMTTSKPLISLMPQRKQESQMQQCWIVA